MAEQGSLLTALQSIDPSLFDRLHAQITAEGMHRYLKAVSETPAPFQTAAHTRGRVVERLLREDGVFDADGASCDVDFQGSGNTVLRLGQRPRRKSIWLLAHLDTITYLVQPGSPDRYPLLPICYHLMEPGQRAAMAVEYDLNANGYSVVSNGVIEVADSDSEPVYLPDQPAVLKPGTRICFHADLDWDRSTGAIEGNLDDAAGAVALAAAFRFLAHYDLELLLGLTDEEEGPAGTGSQAFSRGGARLVGLFEPPELAIVSDIHEAVSMYGGRGPTDFAMGDGASFAGYSSRGVGAVTPGKLYALQRQLAIELAEVGIQLNENGDGYVSRSEDINALKATPNVALLGFLGANRHFQRGPEHANLNDLVQLSKAVVCLCLLTKTDVWRQDDRS